MKKTSFLFGIISLAVFFFTFCSQKKEKENGLSENILSENQLLAQKYCGNCHQFPEPALLNKATWHDYVLPRMGHLLGIFPSSQNRDSLLAFASTGKTPNHIYPEKPIIDAESWQKIQDFYLSQAPDTLTIPATKPIKKGLAQFAVKAPQFILSPPSTTMVRFGPNKSIYIGDAHSQALYHFGPNFQLLNMAKVREGAVNLAENPGELLVTVMGSFAPTDAPSGFLLSLPKTGNKKPVMLLQNLQRPVHTSFADLNQDGLNDIVTCEFGKWTGGLAWWESKENGEFTKHWLRQTPGATKAYPLDFNQDGLTDIVALFGQGDEGIDVFYNQGNGEFKQEHLLQFPPSQGSSFFELVDFNLDGFPDILYTAGDNADYAPILKPYHGIYGYLNNGKNQFSPLFFYPLHGAYAARATDFDGDGDLDIAAISFFPDFAHHSEEGFVYLENEGNYQFSPSTFEDVEMGRWIVMDMADYDQDGDADLILGSLAFETPEKPELVKKWIDTGVPFVVLENKGGK